MPHPRQTGEFRSFTYAELRARPMSRRDIDRAVQRGHLIRVRKGRYVPLGVASEIISSASLGGRLDCVSLLSLLGVFVRDVSGLHVQLDPNAGRLPTRGEEVRAHWRATDAAPDDVTTEIVEALAQACRCQDPRSAVATLDSAWHLGLVDEEGIAEVFARLPERFRALRPLLDPRSESGPETLVRLLLRALGCRVEVQVRIPRVGRVDLLVDGWLIVECDSKAFHSTWEEQRNDRRRDREAASQGYATHRVIAEDVLYQDDAVRLALAGLVARGPRRRVRRTQAGSGSWRAARARRPRNS